MIAHKAAGGSVVWLNGAEHLELAPEGIGRKQGFAAQHSAIATLKLPADDGAAIVVGDAVDERLGEGDGFGHIRHYGPQSSSRAGLTPW